MNDGLYQNNKENISFNCVIIGDKGVGKNSLVRRILTGKFEATERFETVMSDKNYTLRFPTNHGLIILNVSIMDGRSMRIQKVGIDCGIIMFDATSCSTAKNISNWYNDLTRKCESGKPPFVFCGNKIDEINTCNKNSWMNRLSFHNKKNIPLLGISAKTDVDIEIEKPFLMLVRMLMRDKSLYFVESPSSRLTRMKTTTPLGSHPPTVPLPSRVPPKNTLKTEVSAPTLATASSSSDSPIKNNIHHRLFGGSPKLCAISSTTTSNVADTDNRNRFAMHEEKEKESAATSTKSETEPRKKSVTSKEDDDEALAAAVTLLSLHNDDEGK